jgi:hypothetical protein
MQYNPMHFKGTEMTKLTVANMKIITGPATDGGITLKNKRTGKDVYVHSYVDRTPDDGDDTVVEARFFGSSEDKFDLIKYDTLFAEDREYVILEVNDIFK